MFCGKDVHGPAQLLLVQNTHEKAYCRGRCPHRCQYRNPPHSHRFSVRLHFQWEHKSGADSPRIESGAAGSVQNLAWLSHRAHLLIQDLDVHDRDPLESAGETQRFARPAGGCGLFLSHRSIRDIGRASHASHRPDTKRSHPVNEVHFQSDGKYSDQIAPIFEWVP